LSLPPSLRKPQASIRRDGTLTHRGDSNTRATGSRISRASKRPAPVAAVSRCVRNQAERRTATGMSFQIDRSPGLIGIEPGHLQCRGAVARI
jgi:hypothetical protein